MAQTQYNAIRNYNRIISSKVEDLPRIQNNIGDTLDDLTMLCSLFLPLQGVLVSNITLTTGTTVEVQHGLGRAYRGFILVNLSYDPAGPGNPVVFADSTYPVNAPEYVPLVSLANVTCSVWVW